jgi:raffinose/stachyose/melibiose transport system permease protein
MNSEKTMIGSSFIMKLVFGLIKYGTVLFVIIISVFPILWTLLSSFKNNMEVLDNAFSWPSRFSFDSYVNVWTFAKMPMYYANSIIVSFSSTGLALIIYGMAAYVLARFNFKMKNIIFVTFGLTLLVQQTAMIQPIYYLMKVFGLYDTKLALILVYTGTGLPMSIFIMKSYFSSIPKEMEESAYIEGSSFIHTFFRIMLPLAKPAFVSAGVLIFLHFWNEFYFVLLLTSSESNRTVPLALRYFMGAFTYDYPSLFAALILATFPSIVIYIILQEKISESLVAGALKE